MFKYNKKGYFKMSPMSGLWWGHVEEGAETKQKYANPTALPKKEAILLMEARGEK